MSPHKLILTSAVSAGRRVIDKGYDIPKIAKHLDLINLMTYDFHGSWENNVAHHSPLYPETGQNPEFCADFAVNYWIKKGAPPHKLVMGVPLYGRSWTLAGPENYPGSAAKGPGQRSKYVKESGSMTYFECCLAHQKDGWAKIIGDGGPYLTKDDQWVGYDDVDAVTKKAEYALNKGLGGIMVWDTVSDDFKNACGDGPNPLLTAIYNTLHGSAQPSKSSSKPTDDPTMPPTEPTSTTTASTTLTLDDGNLGNNQLLGNDLTQTKGGSSIGGTTRVKEWSTSDSGFAQTTKLPYEWLAWPVFSKSPEDLQNSLTHAKPKVSYPATTSTVTTTTTTVSPFSLILPISSTSRFSSSSSALTWFANCKSLGFAPDPATCSAFYRCTNNYAYRFTCPAGLLWNQEQSSCDWPSAVQCILPLASPNIDVFHPPETSLF